VKLFSKYLQDKGIDYILVREPGGTDVGEKIRAILLTDKTELSPETEFLLFSASRSKLIADVVKPALAEGKVVVMDRYFDSSFAYQGYAGKLELSDIQTITNFAIGKDAIPDLTFLLDLSYEDGMKRKNADAALKNLDRMELKGKAYHDRVREGYLSLAKQDKNRIKVIDATKSIDEVFSEITTEFDARLAKSKEKSIKGK
jgi:dTMP kinase